MHTHTTFIGALTVTAALAGAETLTLESTDALPVADLGSAQVVLTASPAGNPLVAGVTVDLDLSHPWIGDLVITIEHEGQMVRLVDRIGSENFPYACGGDDIVATFEDGATIEATDLCWPGPAPTIYGSVLPADALSVFDGLPAAGDWTVTVSDASAFDSGTMHSIAIHIALAPPTECVGDITGDGATNAADFTVLAGNFGATVPPGTAGDLTNDGVVNAGDFTILAGDFGCAVPE